MKNFTYWKKLDIKGPRPVPKFGNLLDILLKPLCEVEMERYKKFGRIYG